jgi:hypothetical protein
MSIVQPAISKYIIDEITLYINSYRARHYSPPLTWNPNIANFSQQWSYYLVSNNLFKHSGSASYSENLAMFQGYGTDILMLFKKSIDSWYNENENYNYSKGQFSSDTGHFTCLVWKSTTSFGMGISINSATNTVDVVFNASPPGNIIGEFQENVLSPNVIPIPNPVPTPVPVPVPAPVPAPVPVQPRLNKQAFIIAFNNIITALRTNQSRLIIATYINNLINELSTYKSTTNIKNALYNAIYLIQTKQPKMAIYNQIKMAIHYMYEL